MNKVFSAQFEAKILSAWEEVYKKGQLTFWLLLALKDSPNDMQGAKDFIETSTDNTLSADDMSMYRALRRLAQMQLIQYSEQDSTRGGPSRKIYELTVSGRSVLGQFVVRNIAGIYYKPEIKKLILEGEK